MPAEQVILCGELALTAKSRTRSDSDPVHRLVLGKGEKKIHLDIASLAEPLLTKLPPAAADLMEIAAYVFTGDQLCTRGGDREFDYGHKWRRHFHYRIPVRDFERWNSPPVKQALVAALSFLSDDDYDFEFTPAIKPALWPEYLDYSSTALDGQFDDVMLFSGGLDSLCGAIREILVNRRRVALVSHVSTEKVGQPQRQLLSAMMRSAMPGTPTPLHVQVSLNKDKSLGREHSQRTRSFVFGCMAALTALALKCPSIKFFENGVVSLNLPTSMQLIGGRASRTTHPLSLVLLSKLLGLVFERSMPIVNPLMWKTKTDVLREIRSHSVGHLCAMAISCAHTMERTVQHSHCGTCSQCIDRRLAAIAAGCDSTEEPVEMYKHQLDEPLADERDVTQFERYVGTAITLKDLPNKERLMTLYGGLARALRCGPETPDEFLKAAYTMLARHGAQVVGALESLVAKSASALVGNRVHAQSPIAIVAAQSRSRGTQSVHESNDSVLPRKHPASCTLLVDENTFTVKLNGVEIALGNGNEFRFVQCLAERVDQYVSHERLLDDVWHGDTRSTSVIYRTACTLRQKLKPLGVGIESVKGHYKLSM